MRRFSVAFAACLLAAGAFSLPARTQAPAAPGALLGQPAPAVSGAARDGKPVSLAALRGRVVLLNCWGSWCGLCVVEMPRFDAWSRQRAADLAVLGVSMDDDPATARRLRSKLAVHYPILMATPVLAESYGGVLGLPVTFLIDRHGIVRYRFEGETDLALLDSRIRELIAAP
jgi:peroxiredoxin